MDRNREIRLARRCRLGDREAMDTLVRQYEKPVYNAAFRMLGNRDEAADVTQTVFLRVFERLDQFDARHRLFSWIYRIAINESIDQLKKRKRPELLPDAATTHSDGPQDAAVASELRNEVQVVLMELSDDQRAVIALRYFSECSYREIGDILQLPEKTVKSRLFAARQSMKAHLQQHGVLSP